MTKKTYSDQMLREVEIIRPLRSIVSIVPSQTELLADLGLAYMVSGVTKFCVHPKDLKAAKTIVGGTKTLNFDTIRKLNPDLIIGNKEENTQAEIEALEKEFPVWMSDIHDLDSALEMIGMLGEILDVKHHSSSIAEKIRTEFRNLQPLSGPRSALYLIWRKPFMAAGKNTFIDDCLKRCGFINCVTEERYPEVDLSALDPEVILLSSEPYPFREKHVAELQDCFPQADIKLVDGEFFSWYGSRLLKAPAYFQELVQLFEAQ